MCRDFLAPKHIDPKFLDPKHVFKDLAASAGTDKGASANNAQANVFHPEKKRRKRDGYDEGDYTLFHKIPASDFVKGDDPISVLGVVNRIEFSTEEEKQWAALPITTDDIKANCDDLKVLGKGDFKALLRWRLALREEVVDHFLWPLIYTQSTLSLDRLGFEVFGRRRIFRRGCRSCGSRRRTGNTGRGLSLYHSH